MLSDIQKRFCDYYVTSSNASDAYIKAGYKVKSQDVAKASACRLLTNVNVINYIDELRMKTQNSRIADIIEVKEYWTNIMRGGKEEFDSKDRMKASEYLAKSAGAFIEKVQHSGDITINIDIEEEAGDDDG